MKITRRSMVLGASGLVLSGCADRGALLAYNGKSPVQKQRVIAATNRASLDSVRRTNVLSFFDLDVAVPLDRDIGTVPVSGTNAFSVAAQRRLGTRDQLQHALTGENRVAPLVLWVHGYNNTSAEAIYRQAQMAADTRARGPQIAFVWPSAAIPGGYVHDRDSVLHARQPFSDLIDVIKDVWPGEILLIAHSLGAFLAMETLTQRAGWGRSPREDIRGLVLLQPDIALDVFQSQMRALSPRPELTAVVATREDPALRISARVSQSERRVGAFTGQAYYDALGVRLIDVSAVRDAQQPHLVAFSSPTFLNLISSVQNQLSG